MVILKKSSIRFARCQHSQSAQQRDAIYKVHLPTCCCGCCLDGFTEGDPCCGRGCCKVSFHVYPADKNDTSGGAEYAGKILKVPKSMAVEMFTDADAFDVTFPKKSKYEHKGLLIGTAIFLNANFFEGGQDDIGAADQGMDMIDMLGE
jgi:hypothetical protein